MQGLTPGVAPNVARLHSTMQTIENACSMMQTNLNPVAAEAAITAFRQSPRPYESCIYILENSQLANARFQAASAIRDAAIREWVILTDEDRKNLIVFCLHYVMKHSSATEAYVRAKVCAVAAQLLKRGWMDFSAAEKDGFFIEIRHSILGTHGPEAQFSGVTFLESLVFEFSPSTSSAMNLPAEFHGQCKSQFEVQYLKNFYVWAIDAALSVTDKILKNNLSVSEEKVCSAALRLMFQIMNWDFKPEKSPSSSSSSRTNPENLFLKKIEHTLVQPGNAWYDVLILSGHIAWLLGLYSTLRKRFVDDVLWFDSPLAVSSRQLIVQLCSLSGTIFPSDDGQSLKKNLLQILSTVTEWIDPPGVTIAAVGMGRSESEILDGCHVLLSIATLTNTMTFDSLLKSFRSFGTLQLLAMLTCEVANSLAGRHNEEETWRSEAMDILLDTWNVLLGHTSFGDNALSSEGKSICARLFDSLMGSQLKAAASSAFEDDCDSDHFTASILKRDERLSSYAFIARAAADATIPMLATCFSQRVSILLQGKSQTEVTCTMEELYWLILIIGYILTDSGEGETMLVPDALHVHFTNIVEAHQHPVVALSWSVINFAEWSLNPEMRSVIFSPRLMEAVVWFLARWTDTYLMAFDSIEKYQLNRDSDNKPLDYRSLSKKVLLTFSGENNQGKHLLDTFVQISATALISYPGETELQALTCHQLLPALVRRRNVCVHLFSLDSWRSLANAFANERTLFLIVSRLQRSLAETFVRSASSIKESNLTDQYVKDLLGSIVTYLVDFTENNKTVSQQPDVIIMVTCLLERLRGAARATEPRTQKAIFSIALAVMKPLLVLMDIYKDEAVVVYMILKFVVSLVDGQVIFLNPEDTTVLIGFCMHLLQIYSSHNVRKISISLSAGLQSEVKMEKYKDLCALLQLLANLCSKDLVDVSSASDGNEDVDIAQVVYMGLHIVTPLMSLELLKYPKLCYQYFTLLSHMLEVYPEKVAQLNDEGFKHVVATIGWGTHHQDIEVVEMCLRALNALATYHYKEKGMGKEGLGLKTEQFVSTNEMSSEGILSHFLHMLMHLLLFEDFCVDLLGALADALLPLFLCEQQMYQRLMCELIERQPNDLLKSRLTSSLNALTESIQVSSSLDRPNRQRFRKNFHKFFVDVSCFLRIK